MYSSPPVSNLTDWFGTAHLPLQPACVVGDPEQDREDDAHHQAAPSEQVF
jgi:hypothetical protein